MGLLADTIYSVDSLMDGDAFRKEVSHEDSRKVYQAIKIINDYMEVGNPKDPFPPSVIKAVEMTQSIVKKYASN
jgi:hypothetical protein